MTDPRVTLAEELSGELDALEDAQAAIRAEAAAGRITAGQAAAERAGLLERHRARVAAIRRRHG